MVKNGTVKKCANCIWANAHLKLSFHKNMRLIAKNGKKSQEISLNAQQLPYQSEINNLMCENKPDTFYLSEPWKRKTGVSFKLSKCDYYMIILFAKAETQHEA